MGDTKFIPVRQIAHVLDDERTVTVQTDGDRFGLIFRRGEDTTRCLLSEEAMRAVASSFAPLHAGKGEEIKYRWEVVADHRVIRGR